MTSPVIAVLGTGANGATIAADLTRAGHDVVLIDQWPAHVEAMRANGVTQVMRDAGISPIKPMRTSIGNLKIFLDFDRAHSHSAENLVRCTLFIESRRSCSMTL